MNWQELRDRIGNDELGPLQLWRAAKEAHATDDFSNLLSTTMDKALVKLFQGYTPGWNRFCYVDETTKLNTNTPRPIISEARDLTDKPEGAEIRHQPLSDAVINIQTNTKAGGFRITREVIINDDLGAFRQAPELLARAAQRTLEKQVAYKLTSNGTAYDSSAFFVDRSSGVRGINNLGSSALVRTLAGAGYVTAGIKAIKQAKDISGKSICAYRPKFLIVPTALEDVASVLVKNPTIANTTEASATTELPNPLYGYGLELIVWPYLDTFDTNNWYIACDPAEVGNASGLIVSFLRGMTTPKLLARKQLYENGGVDAYGNPACDFEFDVIYDFGVSYGDPATWYGSLVSAGAGPGFGTS